MQSFEELLDFRYLTASFRDQPTLMNYFFTGRYFNNLRDVPTDEWELINYGQNNTPVGFNSVGSPAQMHTPIGGAKRIGSMFFTYNGLQLPGDALNALREPESQTLQNKGLQVVMNAMEEFQQRHRILKEAALSTIFSFGRVCVNANGDIVRPTVNTLTGALSNPSGAVTVADYTIPDSHRGNLDGIIDTMWSSSATKIFQQLEDIDYQAELAGVPKPTDIIVNTLNKRHLRDNAEFQLWAKESNVAPDRVLMGETIEGLWGKNWHFVGGTYQNSSGTTVDLVPQTHAIIVPPNGPWFRAVQGLQLVPNSLELQSDWRAALNALNEVYGEFSYACLEHNPARLTQYMGDKWGCMFPNPNVIWMPNVFETDDVAGEGGTSGTGA